jgi:endonuclease YncB( thermonuclease family)
MRRSLFAIIALLVIAGLLAACEPPPAPASPTAHPSATAGRALPCSTPVPPSGAGSACTPAPRGKWVQAVVISITDGDTVQVRIGGGIHKLRYIGMDTPERSQPGYAAARDANAQLVAGQMVVLEKDCREDDGERLLRYVWLADGRMVNEELVRVGVALAVAYPPDTRHRARLEQAALEAWRESRGFWAGGADAFLYAIVVVNALAIHEGPGEEQAVRGAVMCGDALAVYGRSADGDWLQVRGPDRTGGWVRTNGVGLSGSAQAIPVAQPPN